MTERRLLILRIAGYLTFFMVLFGYFLYLGFPYNAIKDTVIEKIEENSPIRIEILSFSPNMLAGFNFRDVRIYHEKTFGTKLVAKIDRAKVRVGFFSLIRGALKLSVDLELYGGQLKGKLRHGTGASDVNLTLANLDLSRYDLSPFLAKVGDFSLLGQLGGEVQLHLDRVDLQKAKGAIDLNLDGFGLRETAVYGFKIPELHFDPSVLKLELGSKALKIVEGNLKSQEMEVDLGGRMSLRDELAKSSLSYFLKFKPSGTLEDQFGELLKMVKKKDREGFFRVNLSGSLSAPRIR